MGEDQLQRLFKIGPSESLLFQLEMEKKNPYFTSQYGLALYYSHVTAFPVPWMTNIQDRKKNQKEFMTTSILVKVDVD